ncbi:PRC-barrel domain-containing protein [Pseudomonas sp. JM0905a]|uniref:PRC-barrel domain-containing protein n=1 Tax=Pseudomonas sp. JM0905a TaxID=2772484 RepID=UPI001686F526|nr:PRC-barrel domain-containing protein [Pseudomonas sp. JM0905a]MBD2838856.1 PRC-barrel domain-containing protein [Pseudomonas sp. JM0905a]
MTRPGNDAKNEDHEVGPATRRAPELMATDSLIGKDVYNLDGDDLGVIKEIMLDMRSGRVIYAVLFCTTFFSLGEKLFVVPWRALTLDTKLGRFMLDVERSRLKEAPGFDEHHWPDMTDQRWQREVSRFYGSTGWA